MVVTSLAGSRYGRYADDSWKALLLLVVLAVAYLASRRLVITVLIGAATVALVSWALSPNLADTRNGDATVLADIDVQADRGTLAGHHDIAVAEVDLDSAQPVRLAGIGADDTTPMEVGSMTKAMTGLVIADAVSRGEIRMDAPVATYLPQLGGSPAGAATMQRARHAHVRIRRVRRRHPASRRLGGAVGPELPDGRHHADDRGGQGPDPGEWWPVRILLLGCGHRRSSRRRRGPPELPGADAHPAVRAARHVPHRDPGRPPPSSPAAHPRAVCRSSRGSWMPTHPPAEPSPPPAISQGSPPHSSTEPPPA